MHFSRSPFIALAVRAMIGRSLNVASSRILSHRFVAIHLRHHHVDERDVDVGFRSERLERLLAGIDREDLHLLALEHRGQREDVADVVIDDQDFLVRQRRFDLVGISRGRLLVLAAFRIDPFEDRAELFSKALGRPTSLTTMLLADLPSLSSSLRVRSLAV